MRQKQRLWVRELHDRGELLGDPQLHRVAQAGAVGQAPTRQRVAQARAGLAALVDDGARRLRVEAGLRREQLEQRVAIVGDVGPRHRAFVEVDMGRHFSVAHHELAVTFGASAEQGAQHVRARRLRSLALPLRRPEARDQDLGGDGLAQQVVGADAQAFDQLVTLVLGGDEQDVRLALERRRAHATAHLGAGHGRHHPVQQQRVGRLVAERELQRQVPVLHRRHVVRRARLQCPHQQLAAELVVVRQHDPQAARSSTHEPMLRRNVASDKDARAPRRRFGREFGASADQHGAQRHRHVHPALHADLAVHQELERILVAA